jgi:predicted ATPase/serine phosphatase RsbU (regulator of sigma subunit)/tRNA A-37 threonylcarbamoyl transferase component Bud32
MIDIPGFQVGEKIYESVRSVVYRAKEIEGNRPVILKTLKEEYPDPQEILRYRQEYETTRRLDVAGIPRPIGFERAGNRLILITEDIGGQDLKTLLKTHTFTLRQLLKMAANIVRILREIHAANLIHADIKPSNIVCNLKTKQLQIIDFGSARALSDAVSVGKIQVLAGTLSYMSPEQTGRMNRPVDRRTDFYSLGVALYELFTGKLPFETTDALELVHAHIARKPRLPSELDTEVPGGLSDIIMKLLAKNPEDRYQSTRGIEADLVECLRRLENTGRINAFPLARQDVSDQFQISRKLVGRQKEIDTLAAAYDRVSRGGKELMLIAGPAGIGKTALVLETAKEFARHRGLFLQGQFGAADRNVPYAAIVAALHDLVRQLLTESQERLLLRRERILAVLGANGQVLLDLIPDAAAIVGNQPPVMALEPAAAQRRIKLVLLNFIRVFCRPEQPLVLFLDSLNLADAASLDLIQSLMVDDGIEFLLLIGTYRDEETDTGHPLHKAREALREQSATVGHMDLENLNPEHIALVTADTLRCDRQTAESLVQVLVEKTGGNPFFLNEFLNLLYSENLLHFDGGQQRWQWDIAEIRSRMITDNVVELLSDKLQRLDNEALEVITMAAAIGSQFDLQTLAVSCEKSREQTAAALSRAKIEGLIVPLGTACLERYGDSDMGKLLEAPADHLLNCEFKFSHDRIQQAAYALVPASERSMLHYQIGKRLQQNAPLDEGADHIFLVVDQLNAGRVMLTSEPEHMELAKLNLSAGKRAKAAAVFAMALRYFKTGLDLLQDNCWQAQYDLALALHTQTVEGAFLCSDTNEMEKVVRIVLQHARSPLDQALVYEVKILALTAQNRWAEACRAALEILRKLGLNLPTAPGKLQVWRSLLKTKLMMAGKSLDHLAQLPPMTDPSKTAIMRIIMRVNAALAIIYPAMYPVLANEQLRMTVRHGNGPASATAYLNYGMLLGSKGDMEAGYQFGQLALQFLEQPQAEVSRIPTRFAFNLIMRHWKEHLRETLAPFLELHQAAREIGDVFYVAYSSAFYCVHMFLSGWELPEIEKTMAEHDPVAKATGVQAGYHFMRLYRQVVANLLDSAADPCRLAGHFYDEEKMLAIDTEADNKGRDFGLYNCKLLLCLLFRQPARAVKNADRVEEVMEGPTALGSGVPAFYCWSSLARLACYPDVGPQEKGQILKRVEDAQTQLRRWARQSPLNYRHKYDLVNAVRHWVLRQDSAAMALFDRVIKMAGDGGFLQDKAMANELAARFYLGKDRVSIARAYMTEARYAYLRWGAASKVRDLDETFPELLSAASGPLQANFLTGLTDVTITSSDTSERLDLASVLKSTQAMSSEIVLTNLLEKLLNITMENAGAQRGFLVLESGGQLLVEAEMSVERQNVTVRQSTPLESSHALSRSIVNYVARTLEPVVLDDAATEGKFANTPYVLKIRPKSILCMPLTTKDKLAGVLYLENNLATGAFTPGHLEALKVLSSQAVISLENARLYDRLADYSRSLEAVIAALNLAQEVQQNLLPQRPPQLETIDVAGRSLYCDETGGDYYDYIELQNGSLGIVVGDVSGHGISAALLMASVRAYLRARSTLSSAAGDIITGVNRLMSVDTAETGQFMTLFYLVVEPRNNRIIWVRAGHDPGFLYCPHSDEFEALSGAGMALGVDENWKYEDYNRAVKPGQIVLLTTDGIFEAHSPEGEMFGKERFKGIVRKNADLEAEGIRKAVFDAVTEYRGDEPQEDDITLVILKFS